MFPRPIYGECSMFSSNVFNMNLWYDFHHFCSYSSFTPVLVKQQGGGWDGWTSIRIWGHDPPPWRMETRMLGMTILEDSLQGMIE